MPAVVPFIPLIASGISAASGYFSGKQQQKQNEQIQQGMAQTQAQQQALFNQAQQVIPGMQQVAQGYGVANGAFLGDRQALGELGGQYGALTDQMARLYQQGNPAAEGMGLLRGLMGYDPAAQGDAALAGLLNRAGGSDDGAAAALRANAAGVMRATDPGIYQRQAEQAGNAAMSQIGSAMASRGILSSGTTSRVGAATLSRLYSDAAARGQQDRLNAYGISNSALGAAGNMALQRTGMEASLAGQLAGLGIQRGQYQAGLANQLAGLGMQGGQYQAGLLGQMGNLLGAQQQNILAGSGLLGNYLQGLQGQYGMQQGIAGLYNQQAGALGGMWNQQASQVNPNPYGGAIAGIGAIGNAAAQYMDYRAKQGVGSYGGGTPLPGFGVTYRPA